jgi:hypothetical protein
MCVEEGSRRRRRKMMRKGGNGVENECNPLSVVLVIRTISMD